jgi:hypothetical protein
MPAKAGIQKYLKKLDFRFRGNDAQGRFKIFYETVKNGFFKGYYQFLILSSKRLLPLTQKSSIFSEP